MSVRYARETLSPGLEAELEGLVRDYYATTRAHIGIPPYDFRWEVYRAAEAAGALELFTARGAADCPGKLLGWALYLVAEAPHHRGLWAAECDTLAVDYRARGRGIGRGLVAFATPHLRARGVARLIHRHRLAYGDEPLFPKLGFAAEEVIYTKEI